MRQVLARWDRYNRFAIDEVGYRSMADLEAECLFQVIAERAEKAAFILTTNYCTTSVNPTLLVNPALVPVTTRL